MSRLKLLFLYLRYLLRAKTKYDVHSPFVFNLLTNVIQNKEVYYVYQSIEQLRQELLQDSSLINGADLGAGSKNVKNNNRSISEIARYSLKPAKYGQLLFRLVNHFQPQNILELGTSLGITTMYMAQAISSSKLITIEGSGAIAKRAQQNFNKLNATNIKLVEGNFDEVLNSQLMQLKQLDFVFFDGNHRKGPTLSYFEQCLKYSHNDSVFIFDDIHWSEEMQQAWHQIKQHLKVTITIDLFFIGIVFFKKEQAKEHFILRF